MFRLVIIFFFVLADAPSFAQISEKELTLAGMSDCIKEAIDKGSVEGNGPIIVLFCNEAKAKTLYNFLGRKVRAEVVQDTNGKFESRPFGNNACYHRTEDPSGKTADEFRCDFLLTIGDILDDESGAK
jgi:hypothetical protein